MGLTVKETGGGSYTPIEAGTYPARCIGVIDLGIQRIKYNNKEKDQERLRIVWELPDERVDVDGISTPRWMSKPYTASLHEKATLRKDLDAWRGKPFTPEELAGFDLKNVVGAPCLLTIIHQEGQNGTYAKVGAISRPMKGQIVPELEGERFIFDMDAPNAADVLTKLPKWMQDEITNSITWKAKENASLIELDEKGDGEIPF